MARALQHRSGFLGFGFVSLRPLRIFVRIVVIALLSLLALSLIFVALSQTAPFKEWVRGIVVRQAAGYLNGTLAIDHLDGTLLTGVELDRVTLLHEGRPAVAVEKIVVDYNILTLIREGIVLDKLVLTKPAIYLERGSAGWNFRRFVKDREPTGERKTIGLQDIQITDGSVHVRDRTREPYVFTDLDTRLRFSSSPRQIAVSISELTSHIAPFGIRLRQVSGSAYFREDNIDARDFRIVTDRSDVTGRLVLQAYRSKGTLDTTVVGEPLSLPELSRFLPGLEGMTLEPNVNVDARGTLDELHMDVVVDSSAGRATGPLVADFRAPGRNIRGTLDLERVNLAPLVKAAGETRITGQSRFDVTLPEQGRRTSVSFRFAGPEARAFGYHVTNLQAQGLFENQVVRVEGRGNAYGASARGRAVVQFPRVAGGAFSYATSGQFANLDLRNVPRHIEVPRLDSRLAGSFDVQGQRRQWIADVKLNESALEGATIAPGTIAHMAARDRALEYSATGHITNLDVQRFADPLRLPVLREERFRSRLNGDFTMTGSGRTFDQLHLDLDAAFVDSVAVGGRFPQFQVDMQIANRRLTAAVEGSFEDFNPAVLGATRLDPAVLAGTTDMDIVVAQLGAPLTPDAFEATGHLTLAKSSVAGVAIDTADVSGSYVNRVARFDRLMVSGAEIAATATGTLALDDRTESKLDYDVTASDLTLLAKLLDRPVRGSGHAQGTITGPAARMTSVGTLAASQFQYGDKVDVLTITSTFNVTVPDLDFKRASGRADSTAAFVNIGGFNLTEVSAETIYNAPELEFRASFAEQRRAVDLAGVALLHPEHQEAHLRTLSLGIGETVWRLAEGREAQVRYGDRAIRITGLDLQRAEQRLAVNGTFLLGEGDAKPIGASDVEIRAERLQIRDINELLLGERQLAGTLDGTARVRGTAAAPEVEGMFSVTNGQVEGVAFEALTGDVRYSNRTIALDVQLRQSPGASLTAMGTVPLSLFRASAAASDDPIDLRVQSTSIDAGLFQSLTSHVEKLHGQMQVDLRATGSARTPRVDGRLDLTGAGFLMPTTGVLYDGLTTRLRFAGDRVVVDQFRVMDDDGDLLIAEGALGFQERRLGGVDVVASGAKFTILDNQLGHISLDLLLRITGEAQRPVVEGNIETRAGTLDVDRLLQQFTRSPYRTEAAAPAGESSAPPNLFDAMSLALNVHVSDNLVLRGNDIRARFSRIGLGDVNLTVGGDLDIRKSPNDETRLVGTVAVVRGVYDFQGRRFEVQRDSLIRFEGTDPLDPTLRMTATRDISGVVAEVNLRGTVRMPELILSSQPPLDEADILSLIVFNQPVNQLGQNERFRLVERAGALAAGYVTAPLADSIAEALDLDLFEIRAAGEAGGGPAVSFGEQLGSRLFVGFQQEFGAADMSQLSFEYRLTELLRLVTSIAQGTRRTHRTQRLETSAADLILVISY